MQITRHPAVPSKFTIELTRPELEMLYDALDVATDHLGDLEDIGMVGMLETIEEVFSD